MSATPWTVGRYVVETLAANGIDTVFGIPGVHNIELRSEEHTSELQSLRHLVCRLLLEKKKKECVVVRYVFQLLDRLKGWVMIGVRNGLQLSMDAITANAAQQLVLLPYSCMTRAEYA